MSTAPSPNLASYSALSFVKGPERPRAPAAIERLDRRGECFEALDVAPSNHALRWGAGELASPAPLPRGERESARGTPRPGAKGALGTTPKSIAQADEDRAAQYRAARRRNAKLIDMIGGWGFDDRVAGCGRRPISSAVALHRRQRDGKALVVGVGPCSSVWLCPCCGALISWQRRKELNCLLCWARKQGFQVVMMTLTARHHRGMPFDWLLAGHRGAMKRLRQSKLWRALKDIIVGHVTATETPCGPNGFHPHTHTILILRAENESSAIEALAGLRTVWERALQREGLDCNDHGFDIRGHAGAGDYIAKWGVAEELTFSQAKTQQAPKKGRTPWQLLAIAAGLIVDDLFTPAEAKARWLEFARAIKGRRQLVWSKGLKKRAGIGEVSDDEIVSAVELKETEEVGRMTAREWWAVVRAGLRIELLEAVENEGVVGFLRVLTRVRRQTGGQRSSGLGRVPQGFGCQS